jgi:cellobiose-specific phosphotransferase system component IIC
VTRYGEDVARREAQAQARFSLAVVVWIIPIALGAFLNASGERGIALVAYLIVVLWLPVVAIAWRNLRRARNAN